MNFLEQMTKSRYH